MDKPNFLYDLHCHTKRSDGNDEPMELINEAQKLGMKVIAITDHDIIPPAEVINNGNKESISVYAELRGVKVIKGMEISCDTDVEDVHMLAFGCNWKSDYLTELNDFIKQSKIDSYRKLSELLRKNGMQIKWDELLENNGEYRKPENIQKKHIFELMASKGYTKSWQEAKILVRDNPIFKVKRIKPDSIEVINIIHKTGGICILAHPYLIDDRIYANRQTLSRSNYIDKLIDNGLDGMEVCYPYNKTSYKGNQSNEQIWAEVLQQYQNAVKVLSGGSDYHADEKKGVKNARALGECGIEADYFYSNNILKGLVK